MSSLVERPSWAESLEGELGVSCKAFRSVPGGDVAHSYRVDLTSGDRLFVKDYGDHSRGIAAAEAIGIEWLRAADALRLPELRGHGPDWLALEWIDSGTPLRDFADRLGHGLARLHAVRSPEFGFEQDNWIGSLPQSNARHERWASFYAACRLRPLRNRAVDKGVLPASSASLLDELVESLPDLVGPIEWAARLHGDLWSGNLMVDEAGEPCLIDPSVYAGHREVDLAMMRLFGGFPERVFEAYDEIMPLATGARERVDLYQVYPLLVHVWLFGAGYVDRLDRAVRSALSRRTVA